MTEDSRRSAGRKRIRVNSIADPSLRRILKPCEARAGHGIIGMFIALAVAGIFVTLIVKGVVALYGWIFG